MTFSKKRTIFVVFYVLLFFHIFRKRFYRYCLKAISICMGPYVFLEESSCRIFAFDMIKRPHKLTLEKQESICKKPLFTSFVHTIKLKLVIGDDVQGGVCLKLAFDPIELVGIFATDTLSSSMVMRNSVQLDTDVEFSIDVDEDDNVLLVERLNYAMADGVVSRR